MRPWCIRMQLNDKKIKGMRPHAQDVCKPGRICWPRMRGMTYFCKLWPAIGSNHLNRYAILKWALALDWCICMSIVQKLGWKYYPLQAEYTPSLTYLWSWFHSALFLRRRMISYGQHYPRCSVRVGFRGTDWLSRNHTKAATNSFANM